MISRVGATVGVCLAGVSMIVLSRVLAYCIIVCSRRFWRDSYAHPQIALGGIGRESGTARKGAGAAHSQREKTQSFQYRFFAVVGLGGLETPTKRL
jgi:hypothetical protein